MIGAVVVPAVFLLAAGANHEVVRRKAGRSAWQLALALGVVPGVVIFWNEWAFRHGRHAPDSGEVAAILALAALIIGGVRYGWRSAVPHAGTYLGCAVAATLAGFSASRIFGPLGDSFNDQAALSVALLAVLATAVTMILGAPVARRDRALVFAASPCH